MKAQPLNCPLCNFELKSFIGTVLNNEGITLYCDSKTCPAQEVFGYGHNEASAFEIIKQKYKPIISRYF